MTTQNGRAFNEWLRAQLKAKKMSQRQLAQQSGVDHSTISRLIRGDRMPSLGTATKLARGLRELRDDADTPQYLGLVSAGATNPTARVEYALRADEYLTEPQVRQIMEYYLAVRMRRFGRAFQPGKPRAGPERPTEHRSVADRRPPADRRASAGTTPGRASASRSARPTVTRSGRPGAGPLLAHFQGTTRIALHRPGLGDSERRRLGRRRSRFPRSERRSDRRSGGAPPLRRGGLTLRTRCPLGSRAPPTALVGIRRRDAAAGPSAPRPLGFAHGPRSSQIDGDPRPGAGSKRSASGERSPDPQRPCDGGVLGRAAAGAPIDGLEGVAHDHEAPADASGPGGRHRGRVGRPSPRST